jgi:hypothetical protein
MWKGWQLSLELAAPLHCGWRTVGNLKQTRPYVAGPVFWGALAARLARDVFGGRYREAELWVDAKLRFTYLFPSLSRGSVTHWPWGRSAGEFDWTFLNSYVSTALVNGRVKDDGMLHETEYIAPHSRGEGKKGSSQVFLTGCLWEACDWERSILDRLQLGGERGYGWGRVRNMELKPLAEGTEVFGSWIVSEQNGEIVLSAKDCIGPLHLAAHAAATADSELELFDTPLAEPWLGRRIRPGGGQYGLSEAVAAWAPGSALKRGLKPSFRIGARGQWYWLDSLL